MNGADEIATAVADDSPAQKPGMKTSVRKLSLKIAGYLYSLGDLSLFTAGVLKGNSARNEAITGLTWFAGGVAAAAFGNEKPERKQRRMRRDLSEYLRAQGIEIPSDSLLSQQSIAKESSALDGVGDFMYKHPSQMLNGAYAVGAAALAKSGFDAKAKTGKVSWGAVGSGLLVEAGALGGLMIPEYTSTPEKPKGLWDKAVHWVREKPLRFSAIAYWLNEGTLFKKGLDDRKNYPGNKSYLFTFFTVACYLAANALLLITPKEEANKKNPLDISPMEKALADILALQLPDKQQMLLHQICGFLAAKPEIGIKAEVIAEGVNRHLVKKMQRLSTQRTLSAVDAPKTYWQDKAQHSMPVAALAM